MIKGVHKCRLYSKSSSVLMLPHHSTINAISNKKIAMTTFTLHIYLLSFCIVTSKYWVFIFITYSKHFINWWKFESSYMQGKCYKPHNQVNFFRTCLSKTMIISDMIDFIKAISCLEDHPYFHKTKSSCYIFKFLIFKCYKSTQNLISLNI